MASSSAPDGFRYDGRFRGEDTRKTFTSHLLAALDREQIKTYIDYELKSGEEIAPALLKAIEDSKLSVVILSQNYASSTWCLDELAHIMECKERYKQLVIPIFYEVDPSHVRHQRESYAAAFVRHEEHFKDTPDKGLKWRDALTKASKLAGFDSRSFGQESELVEGVVEVVEDNVMKLNRECSSDLKGLVGIESHIKLCIAPQDVEFSSSLLINEKELDRSVAEDECFKHGRPGHWVKDCPSAGNEDLYGRKMGREAYSSSGGATMGEEIDHLWEEMNALSVAAQDIGADIALMQLIRKCMDATMWEGRTRTMATLFTHMVEGEAHTGKMSASSAGGPDIGSISALQQMVEVETTMTLIESVEKFE